MGRNTSTKLVNRVGVALKYTLYNAVDWSGQYEILERDKHVKLKTSKTDPEPSKYYEFSCHEALPGHRPPTLVRVKYAHLVSAKIIYIRFCTKKNGPSTKLICDIIPRHATTVTNLLGNKSASSLWVGEKFRRKPRKNLWSEFGGLATLGRSDVVKIKYYNHDSRDSRTSYEVFVSSGSKNSHPPAPSAKVYTGVRSALFGATTDSTIPFFQDKSSHPPKLQIGHGKKPRLSFFWRPLLF